MSSSQSSGVPSEGGSIFGPRARPDYTVDPDTGCWVWAKALNPGGYPGGRAHRRYYERAYGTDITGLDVHHVCRNPACVNPQHLEAVDRSTHLLGHKRSESPLTEDDVVEIRLIGDMTMAEIAAKYSVPETTIWDIRRGKNWKGIGPDRPEAYCVECGILITSGHRHKKFCSPEHRQLYNSRKPSYKAKRADAQRRRRDAKKAA